MSEHDHGEDVPQNITMNLVQQAPTTDWQTVGTYLQIITCLDHVGVAAQAYRDEAIESLRNAFPRYFRSDL